MSFKDFMCVASGQGGEVENAVLTSFPSLH